MIKHAMPFYSHYQFRPSTCPDETGNEYEQANVGKCSLSKENA